MADKNSNAQVYIDYLEMIEQGGIQALEGATPDDLHYPITPGSLQASL